MGKGVVVFCVVCLLPVVFGAPGSKCPPGGTYFDKHLGQYGRWQCCSEICLPRIFKDICQKTCPNFQKDKADASSAAKEDDSSHVGVVVISVVVPVALLLIVVVTIFGWKKRGWFTGVSPLRPLGNQRTRQQLGREGGPENHPMVVPDDPRNILAAGQGDDATEEVAGSSARNFSFGQSEGNLSSHVDPPRNQQQQGCTSGDYQTAKETGISIQVSEESCEVACVHS